MDFKAAQRARFEFEVECWRLVWVFANQALRYRNTREMGRFLRMSMEKPWRDLERTSDGES